MATSSKTEANPKTGGRVVQERRHVAADWAVTILIFLFGTTTLLQAFVVPTGSMESTVLVGDHLFVDKLAYSPPGTLGKYLLPYSEIKRGDIIVFRYPLNIRETYVKRVAGIPGDRIRIIDKTLYINGKQMEEPYKVLIKAQGSSYLNNFPNVPDIPIYPEALKMLKEHAVNDELVVPSGQYFALGDNRDSSADSRFWGFVPRENIIGKPLMVFWSYDAPTEHLTDGNINVDHMKDLAQNFFTKTRWKRTFHFIRGYPLN